VSGYQSGLDVSKLPKPTENGPQMKSPIWVLGFGVLIVGSLFLFVVQQPAVQQSESSELYSRGGERKEPKPFIFPVMFRMGFEFEINDQRGNVHGYANWIYDWSQGNDQPSVRGDDVYDVTTIHEGFPVYDGLSGNVGAYKYWSVTSGGDLSCADVPFLPFNRKQIEMNGKYQGMDDKKFKGKEAHVWKFTWGPEDEIKGVLYVDADRGIPLGMKTSGNPDASNFPTFRDQEFIIRDFEELKSIPASIFTQRPKQCT